MPQYTVEEEIDALTTAGLLTERQAEAYVYRRIEATPGYAVAEEMGVSESTVSDYVSDAEQKIQQAKDTVDALDEIRHQPPSETNSAPGENVNGGANEN